MYATWGAGVTVISPPSQGGDYGFEPRVPYWCPNVVQGDPANFPVWGHETKDTNFVVVTRWWPPIQSRVAGWWVREIHPLRGSSVAAMPRILPR